MAPEEGATAAEAVTAAAAKDGDHGSDARSDDDGQQDQQQPQQDQFARLAETAALILEAGSFGAGDSDEHRQPSRGNALGDRARREERRPAPAGRQAVLLKKSKKRKQEEAPGSDDPVSSSDDSSGSEYRPPRASGDQQRQRTPRKKGAKRVKLTPHDAAEDRGGQQRWQLRSSYAPPAPAAIDPQRLFLRQGRRGPVKAEQESAESKVRRRGAGHTACEIPRPS